MKKLLEQMASHMAYMQTCLKEENHLYGEFDDFYWFRESQELLDKAAEILGKDFR